MNWPFELPQEPAATVKNNNTPHWTVIVETKPNVTLDLGTKLYTQEQVNACIIAALRWAAKVAGPINDKPCCGCIVESGEGGYYSQCDCGNYGDAERAAAWCADANTSRAILAALPKE